MDYGSNYNNNNYNNNNYNNYNQNSYNQNNYNRGSYKSNPELKNLARMQMSGNMKLMIGAPVLYAIITFFVSNFILMLTPAGGIAGNILSYAVSFIILVISFVMRVGLNLIFLKTACGMPAKFSDLFGGFKSANTDTMIRTGVIMTLIHEICQIPFYIINYRYTSFLNDTILPQIDRLSAMPSTEAMTLSIQIINSAANVITAGLACNVFYFIITLALFPIPYMVIDFTDLSVRDLFEKSVNMMNGSKLRYVGLVLSFIPIMFLSMFTFGIALIWVIPYFYMTTTNFYLNLAAVNNQREY